MSESFKWKNEVEARTYDEDGENLAPWQGIPQLLECEVELLDAVYFTIDLDCVLLRPGSKVLDVGYVAPAQGTNQTRDENHSVGTYSGYEHRPNAVE